ncbi:MAG TPA: alginate lyase family protein, partial [Verrucomicrobiae bacterium]
MKLKDQNNGLARGVVFGAILAILLASAFCARAFQHPGVPLTVADLDCLKTNLNTAPWNAGYSALTGDSHSQLSYTMQGPFTNVSRSPDINLWPWRNDMIAIWNLSRLWYFTGNTNYAQKAHDILLAWANKQTSFTGGESMLDLGDYAFRFVGGADILRSTWPGWTAADTAAVTNYFGAVLLPATNPYGDSMYGAANKGALALVSGGLLAIFNDDTNTLNTITYQLRTLAHIGLRSSDDIGLIGDSLRDQGHANGQLFSLAMLAEALWKQGIDVYSDDNNRLLADGEYFARVNSLATTPFLPFGTTDQYYIADNTTHGWSGGDATLNLIHGAYVVRKGLPAPYTDLRIQSLSVDQDSFMFIKQTDSSTATPAAALSFPATTSITSGFTDVDIGGASPAGTSSYSGGTWTVQGAGSEMWLANDSCHFSYVAITGDCAIIARVTSVQNTAAGAKAGVMMRTSLSQGSPRAWMAVTPRIQFEQNIQGLGVYGGDNYACKAYNIPNPSYWVKLERVGAIITGYVSQDGCNWAATDVGRFNGTPPATLYVGLMLCSLANGTLNTSTFSNVQITGGDGGGPIVTPAAPAALLASPGAQSVPLRWQSSFGAASYNVLRSATSGGPYATIATGITNDIFVDGNRLPSTTYYYVVTASNVAGSSGNSMEDSATTQSPPAAPAGVNAFAGNAQATLIWIPSSGATSYNVKRSTTSGSGYLTVTNSTGTSYFDRGLANGTTYYYVISALSAAGEGSNSIEVSVTPSASATALLWSGAVNGAWDTTTANWLNGGSSASFADGNTAIFEDSAPANTAITLPANRSPGTVFFNNTAKNYSLSGSAIAGTGNLTKQGSG